MLLDMPQDDIVTILCSNDKVLDSATAPYLPPALPATFTPATARVPHS